MVPQGILWPRFSFEMFSASWYFHICSVSDYSYVYSESYKIKIPHYKISVTIKGRQHLNNLCWSWLCFWFGEHLGKFPLSFIFYIYGIRTWKRSLVPSWPWRHLDTYLPNWRTGIYQELESLWATWCCGGKIQSLENNHKKSAWHVGVGDWDHIAAL